MTGRMPVPRPICAIYDRQTGFVVTDGPIPANIATFPLGKAKAFWMGQAISRKSPMMSLRLATAALVNDCVKWSVRTFFDVSQATPAIPKQNDPFSQGDGNAWNPLRPISDSGSPAMWTIGP